jgi:hypothetical protein
VSFFDVLGSRSRYSFGIGRIDELENHSHRSNDQDTVEKGFIVLFGDVHKPSNAPSGIGRDHQGSVLVREGDVWDFDPDENNPNTIHCQRSGAPTHQSHTAKFDGDGNSCISVIPVADYKVSSRIPGTVMMFDRATLRWPPGKRFELSCQSSGSQAPSNQHQSVFDDRDARYERPASSLFVKGPGTGAETDTEVTIEHGPPGETIEPNAKHPFELFTEDG